MRNFNVCGTCLPRYHYMVDISDHCHYIRKMVDNGAYFCINRGRQYGKTTTIKALKSHLSHDYAVFSLSFETIGETDFSGEDSFAKMFLGMLN